MNVVEADLASIMPNVPVRGKKRGRNPRNFQSLLTQPTTTGQSSTTRQLLPTSQPVSSTTSTRFNLRKRATNNKNYKLKN